MKRKYLWKKKFLALVLSTIMVFSSADTTVLATGIDVSESAEEEAGQPETMESMKETKLSDSDEGEKETDNDGTQDDEQELLEKESKDSGETFETENSVSIKDETEETEKKSYASVEKYTEIEAETESETYGNETVSNGSSSDLNTAVSDKLNKYRSDSVFGNGVIWGGTTDGSYNWNGWYQCCGFALQFANTVFGTYPATLRSATNGATYAGWTCYYVTADNCNTLTVEPGDIIDSPSGYNSSGKIKHHTAMVLSGNNSNFTCVQCNYKSGDGVYNKIHYGEYFNYNTNRSSLPKLWAVYGGYTDSGSHAMRLWKPSDSLKRGATGSTSGGSDTPSVSHGCDASITVDTPSNNSIVEGNVQDIELSTYDYHGIKSYSVTVKYSESGDIVGSWSDNLSGSGGYQISTSCYLQREGNYEITVNIECTNGSKYSQTSYFTVSNPNCHTGENDSYGGSIEYGRLSINSTEWGYWAQIGGCLNDMHGIGTYVENVYLVEDDEEILVRTKTSNSGDATGLFLSGGYIFENYGLHKFTLTQTCQSGYVHYYEFYLNYEDPNAEPEDVCHASGTLTSSESYDITNNKTITLSGNVHDDSGLTAYDIYYRLIDETEEKLYYEKSGLYGKVTDAEFERNYFTFPDYGTYYISLKAKCANQSIHEVDSLVLTYFDHSGKIGDILWDIDENGHLTITGEGDYINYITSSTGNPPWSKKDVKTATVSVTGITSTANMFHDCSNLTNVDLSELDTSNVTDMSFMFDSCSSLTSLDLSTFQTENVTDMQGMFAYCSSLTELDLSSFDLSCIGKESEDALVQPFSLCNNLLYLRTPRNCSVNVQLPGYENGEKWYDENGTKYSTIPNLSYSITLCKDGYTGKEKEEMIVTYDMQGHGTQIAPTTVKSGDKLTAPITPIAEGYTFRGWYKEASCIDAWNFDADMVTDDITLFAKWSKIVISADVDIDDSDYSLDQRVDLSTVGTEITKIKSKVYDGMPYEPMVKVTVTENGKKKTLTEGADYRVLYKNNVNAGTGTVIVRGNGIYKGELTKNFTISKKSVTKLKIVTGSIVGNIIDSDLPYLPIYVYDGTKLLQLNKDYTFSDYSKVKSIAVNVTVKAVKNSNYTGSVSAKLNVYESGLRTIDSKDVKLDKESVFYTGKPIKNVNPIVTVNGTKLTKKDYSVQYQNNKEVGTAFVIVTGKGEYKGKVVKPFEIEPVTLDLTIKGIPAKTYNGKLQKPSITVTANGKKLSKKDYTVLYTQNLHAEAKTAQKAQVTVVGKGNYDGAQGYTVFTINPQKIAKASVKGTQGNLILTYNKRVLKEGTDYTLQYSAAVKNKTEVTITGKGDFSGTVKKKVAAQEHDGKEENSETESSKTEEDKTEESKAEDDSGKEDSEKEREINEKLNTVYKELNLDNLSQIEKIEKIYDYVVKNVTYDSESEMRYTLYGALIDGKAVCNGYALLMERMLTDNNILSQYIAGIGLSCTGGPARHAWNIVKYNGAYYNLDATWDCTNGKTREWFMKSQADFEDHVRDAEYNTEEFLAAYPMAKYSYGEDGPLLRYENLECTFNVAGGGTVSTSTAEDKKTTILIFGQTTCANTMSFLRTLKEKEFCKDNNLKIIFADVDGKDDENMVAAFKKDYGTDNMYFCYDTGSVINFAAFQYYSKKYASGGSFVMPLVVVIDSQNKVRFIRTYPASVANVEQCLERLEQE